MRKWFIDQFLPMWAKETVLQENKQLQRQNERLQQEIDRLDAYIAGLHKGLRAAGRGKGGNG